MAKVKQQPFYFLFLLHAHLPFVRRPDHEQFLEENWLFEAISETYLPLLRLLDTFSNKHKIRWAISLSPTLISMLADEFLHQRYRSYLERQLQLCLSEKRRLASHKELLKLIVWYEKFYNDAREMFDKIHGDLLHSFRLHAHRGALEILTTCATHAFLPLYRSQPALVHWQLEQGLTSFQKHFGCIARGLWLPECGYYEGVEKHIKTVGFDYFFVSGRALEGGGEFPQRGVFAPIECRNGSTAFVCDKMSMSLVWESQNGYPSKAPYRDFHRDIGYELPLDYLSPYLPCADRVTTGFKYYAVGDPGMQDIYNPEKALQSVRKDAQHFVAQLEYRAKQASNFLDRPPLLCCAFDAELFGHWWREGADFIEEVFKLLDVHKGIQALTPSDYLKLHSDNQKLDLIFSSWGDGGFAQSWLDSSNSWLYRHIYGTALNLTETLLRHDTQASISQTRMLNQALRELLLAMASDWPLIIAAGSMSGYAERCVRQHLKNCQSICIDLANHHYCGREFAIMEKMNNIFPELDFRDYLNDIRVFYRRCIA